MEGRRKVEEGGSDRRESVRTMVVKKEERSKKEGPFI